MKTSSYKSGDIVSRVLTVIFGIALGIGGYVLYLNISHEIGFFFIAIDILVFAVIYFVLNSKHKMQHSRRIAAVVKGIDSIYSGEKFVGDAALQDDLKEIFDAIDRLSESVRSKDFNRSEILNMVNSVASNMELEKLLDALMPKIIDSSKSNWGAFYLANNATKKLEIKSSIGFNKNIYREFDIDIGEGLIGEAALTKELRIINDIPDDTVFVSRTFLGKIKPKNIMLVPIINQDQLVGVLALASLYEYTSDHLEIVDLIKFYIGAAVSNGVIFERTTRLTNELQFQNRLIQDLNDVLEEKMNDGTRILNNVVNSITDYAIYALNVKGIVITWNTGAENIFGYAAEEIVGKHISYIYGESEMMMETLNLRLGIVAVEGRYTENGWRKRKDGTLYYADVILFGLYDDDNQIIGYTNVTKDITKLKEAQDGWLLEKELNFKIIKGSQRAIVLLDSHYSIEIINEPALQLLDAESIAGIEFAMLFEEEEEMRKFISLGNELDVKLFKCKKNNKNIMVNVTKIKDTTGYYIKNYLILKQNVI